jgi:hypothetical protein
MVFTRDRHGRGSGENSAFQESLLSIVAARDKRIADAKAAKDAFKDRWEAVRDAVIKPVFRETVDCLNSNVLNITCSDENGCSYVLQNINRYSLKYRADQEQDRVICSGSGIDEDKKFELSLLTRDDVESHVRVFVEFCLNNQTN